MRLVIIVPDERDKAAGKKQYYDNFVWRIRDVLRREQLECSVQVVWPEEIQPETPEIAG